MSEDKVGNIQFRLLSRQLSQVVPRKERIEKLIGEGNASGCLSQRTGKVGHKYIDRYGTGTRKLAV